MAPVSAQEAVPDSSQVVFQWIAQAQQYRRQAKIDSAAVLLDAAEAYLTRNPNQNLQYMLLTEQGFLLRELGRYDEAIANFQSILQIVDEDNIHRKAVVNNSIATLLRDKGDFISALAYHEYTLNYRKRVETGGELGLAVSYLNFARTYDDLNRFDQSLVLYERAMHYAALANHSRLYMETMVSFGNVLTRMGNNDMALLYYQRGLVTARELNETWVSSLIYSAMGRAHLNFGETEAARDNFENSYGMIQGIHLPWVVRINLSYLDFLLETRDVTTALAVAEATELIIEELGSPLEKADFLAQKAYLNYLNQDYVAAAQYFSRADRLYSFMVPYRVKPEFYFRKAFNLMAINEEAGLIQGRQALDYLDRYRLELAMTGNIRAGFFSALSNYVSKLALVYLKRGDAEQTFEIAERLKSRVFTEELNLSEIVAESLVELGRSDEFEALQARIIFLENQVLLAEDEAARENIKIQIEQEQLRLEGLLGQIAANNPLVREVMNPPLVTLAQARARLAPETAGLHIITGEHQTGFLIFTDSGQQTGVVNISNEDLASRVTAVREMIISAKPLEELKEVLDEVTLQLIPAEILEKLPSVSRLQISVDGVWAYLPVPALRLNGVYFAQSKTISFTPSFTASDLLRQRHNQNRGRNSAHRALVLANPLISGFEDDRHAQSMLREAQNLRPLPFSELEGRWASEFFPGEVLLKTGAEASEKALMQLDMPEYSLIHFAAHGLMDERNPRFSGLMLAEAPETGTDSSLDGFLRTTEINALHLNADIVVLSACNTGIGRILSGEGVLGLQRSFLNAGSSLVAVTLWSVEDRATSLLMRNFYQNLSRSQQERPRFFRQNTELNYIDALRDAQLSMLENPQYRHPVNWASFIITGK